MSKRLFIILVAMVIQFPAGPGLRAQSKVAVGIYQNEPLVFTDSDGEEKGEIDLLVAIAYSEERSKRFLFNNETLVTNWPQVYTQQDSQIQSLLDLKGKKISSLS
jgi:hypothetical protein